MILAVMKASYAVGYIEAWKTQYFNGVWTHDLTTPVRRSNQLSYEATEFGSWSFVRHKKPMGNKSKVIYEIFHILKSRCEIK